MKRTHLMLTAVAVAVSAGLVQSVAGPQPVVLLEQNVQLKFKLTTIQLPQVIPGSEVVAKFDAVACRMNTRDMLVTLGFRPSAQLIARTIAEWRTTPAEEGIHPPDGPPSVDQERSSVVSPPPQTTITPAVISIRYIVKDGNSEFDVTQYLKELLPVHEPLSCLGACAAGQGVAEGRVTASLEKGVNATVYSTALKSSPAIRLAHLTDNRVNLGDVTMDFTGLSRSKTTIRMARHGIYLGARTDSRVMGNAYLEDSFVGIGIPAAVEGTVVSSGRHRVEALDLEEFLDVDALKRTLEAW